MFIVAKNRQGRRKMLKIAGPRSEAQRQGRDDGEEGVLG